MKIIVQHDTDGDSWLAMYNPACAVAAIGLADKRGWCPLRRFASYFVPAGEILYTQEVGPNRMYDELIDALCTELDQRLAELDAE